MGYLIRMAPEVEDWLADLRVCDRAAADLIDAAVSALRAGGERVGPPLVVPLDDPPVSACPDLDLSYQRQLELLARVRRGVADVATSRKQLEIQAGQLEQQISELGDAGREAMEEGRGELAEEAEARRGAAQELLADVRRLAAAMLAEEERLTVATQRLQAKVDGFWTRKEAVKEAVKAAWTAAQAAAEAAWAEAVIDDASAGTEGAGTGTNGEVTAQSPDPAGSLRLSELRPGAPSSADTRILFTVEPPGTAVFLAAGMESDWLRAWYTEATANCRIRYQRQQGSAR